MSKNIESHVKRLRKAFSRAQPYWRDQLSIGATPHIFPDQPGVYAILRRCDFAPIGYRYQGVNTREPIVLYVGKTTDRRTIADRLADHFGHQEPNFQGSQFAKILLQIVQDEASVRRILFSEKTLIACIPRCRAYVKNRRSCPQRDQGVEPAPELQSVGARLL